MIQLEYVVCLFSNIDVLFLIIGIFRFSLFVIRLILVELVNFFLLVFLLVIFRMDEICLLYCVGMLFLYILVFFIIFELKVVKKLNKWFGLQMVLLFSRIRFWLVVLLCMLKLFEVLFIVFILGKVCIIFKMFIFFKVIGIFFNWVGCSVFVFNCVFFIFCICLEVMVILFSICVVFLSLMFSVLLL